MQPIDCDRNLKGTPVTREERKDQLIRIAEAKGPGALVELILDLEYPSATGGA